MAIGRKKQSLLAFGNVLSSVVARARLDLWLPPGWPQSPQAVHYRWQPRGGQPVEFGSGESLAELDARLGGERERRDARVVVWAPASETLVFYPVRLPARSARTIAQALPYALEDQLLEDPEKLHFAYVRRAGDLAVAVTARERLEHWLAALHEAGWQADALCPAVLSLPLPDEGSWSLACLGDALLVRQGEFAGFACLGPFEHHAPPALLSAAIAEARAAGRLPEHLVCYDPPPLEPASLAGWAQALGVAIEEGGRDFRFYPPPPPVLDLRQGEYAPRARWRERLRPFLPAAAMLAAAAAGTLAMDAVEWWRLQRAQQELAQAMRAIYTTAFPQSRTVLDPYRQMRRELERLEGSSATAGRGGEGTGAFLALLAQAAPAIKDDPRLALEVLRYRPGEGLVLELTVPNTEGLQAFTARLQGQGLGAELLSVQQRGETLHARIRVRDGSGNGAKEAKRDT